MTFKEWCHSIGMDDARVVPNDMVSMEVLKECWDYNQEELKAKDARIRELEKTLSTYKLLAENSDRVGVLKNRIKELEAEIGSQGNLYNSDKSMTFNKPDTTKDWPAYMRLMGDYNKANGELREYLGISNGYHLEYMIGCDWALEGDYEVNWLNEKGVLYSCEIYNSNVIVKEDVTTILVNDGCGHGEYYMVFTNEDRKEELED